MGSIVLVLDISLLFLSHSHHTIYVSAGLLTRRYSLNIKSFKLAKYKLRLYCRFKLYILSLSLSLPEIFLFHAGQELLKIKRGDRPPE